MDEIETLLNEYSNMVKNIAIYPKEVDRLAKTLHIKAAIVRYHQRCNISAIKGNPDGEFDEYDNQNNDPVF